MDHTRKIELIRFLDEYLVNEAKQQGSWLPSNAEEILNSTNVSFDDYWLLFRSLVNVRPPWPASPEFLRAQDELLSALIEEAGIHTVADAMPSASDPRMLLWRGDITTLATDAIVNAANSGMTGCWQPLHYCIDNAIHTYAGVQLRAKMDEIMSAQGHPEPTAQAKITSAYNLPAKHIVHTVGPIASGRPSDLHRTQLAQCYRACLDAAAAEECLSIAFCCISTGVFGFPQREAATIAVDTVRDWLDAHPDSSMAVVFNVFGAEDEAIYHDLLF